MVLIMGMVQVQGFAQQLQFTDTTKTALPDSLESDTVVVDPINPWERQYKIGFSEETNDSLMRWQFWPVWGDWYARQQHVVSFRQGTIGRIDAFLISGIEPRHQSAYVDGNDMSNPVSGLMNWGMVSHHKLAAMTDHVGLDYKSDVHYRNYYLTKPLTYLAFDESKFKYRNLEFSFMNNFDQKTNLEVSFWDRKDGDAFARSDVEGTQFFSRFRRHFNNSWVLQAVMSRNQMDLEESFGYQIPNTQTFPFDRFTTQPLVSNGSSDTKDVLYSVSIHQRKGEEGKEDFNAGLNLRTFERDLTYTADTTGYQVRRIGANARKWFDLNRIQLEAGGSVNLFANQQDSSSIQTGDWMEIQADAKAQLQPFKGLTAGGYIEFNERDARTSQTLGVFGVLEPLGTLKIRGDLSAGEKLPSVQHLYWSSRLYSGNQNLSNESIRTAGLEVEVGRRPGLSAGASGRFRSIENGIHLGPDSSFVNVSEYETLSGTAFALYDVKNWETSLSATLTDFSSSAAGPTAQDINNLDPIIKIKGSAYIKGTIYDGATFVKAGLAGTFSPSAFQSYQFIPDLGYWDLVNNQQAIPSYFRLDLDVSARIRWFFVTLRMENLLDGLGQAGYFESALNPMPPRRFFFALRVIFRN